MTFVIKTRGAAARITTSDYHCPEHGRFELTVERDASGEIPEHMPCAECGASSERVFGGAAVHTQFVISATRGRNDPKPHKYAMDTRKLAEGRKNEYRAERKKIREELRHQRVKDLLS